MKFTKFGKVLLLSLLSAGIILSVTSCIESYATGYLYVTGSNTAQPGAGIISGFSIDHNTGKLTPIHGLPISSGGSNPGRAVLVDGSRFLYVLNQGTSQNPAGSSICTTEYPCQNTSVAQFAVGGNGILTFVEYFYPKGLNSFRLIADGSGANLYVLDHDSIGQDGVNPASATNPNPNCALALGTGVTACGDITAFSINQSTGRLQVLPNSQVTSANCPGATATCPLPYFPVPADPIDFAFTSAYVLTLSGTPATGDSVFPYSYSSSGQLTISQNSSYTLATSTSNGLVDNATAIVPAGGNIYVLDNDPITVDFNTVTTTSASQILPFQCCAPGGALQPQTGGVVPDDPILSNPIFIMLESKGKFLYVANQGNEIQGVNPTSGISGYVINSPFYLSFIADEPYGSGSGPQCIVEDPSDQFIYEADLYDSSVTGRVVDPNSGQLNNLRVASTYSLEGPANWCLMDGRTN